MIADVPGWASFGLWNKYPNQASNDPGNPNNRTINLVAGQRYYIEALQKEGGGADHIQIAWERPDIPGISVIDGSFLEPYNPNVPPAWNQNRYVFSIDTSVPSGYVIGSVNATDQDPVNYTILANNNGAFAIDSAGTLTVAAPELLVPGKVVPVIGAQDAGNGGLYPFESSTIQVEIVVTSGGNSAPQASHVEFEIPTTSIPGTVVGEVLVSDNNPGDILAFSLNTVSPFAIDEKSGRITVDTPLDPGSVTSYLLSYTVTDAGGLSDNSTILVNLVVPIDADADGLVDDWEIDHFGDYTLFNASDDPDGDQLTNFSEMAFGTDPNSNDTSDQEATRIEEIPDSDDLILVYRRPKTYGEMGLSYRFLASGNLINWHFPEMSLLPSVDHPDGITEWAKVRIISPPTTNYFFRVQVDHESSVGGG